MAINFTTVPFQTDLPSLLDLETKTIKRLKNQEDYASWARSNDGHEIINMRQTHVESYTDRPVDGVADESSFNKFVEKYFKGDLQELVKKMGVKLANDGWLCISLHQRPDENVKMEWLANKQSLLTINIAT